MSEAEKLRASRIKLTLMFLLPILAATAEGRLGFASGHAVVALLGVLPLATAALFDLGVYPTVVASTPRPVAIWSVSP